MKRTPTPLILFSGLAADANVFAPQKKAFPHLQVPAWPVPLKNDSLSSYCERLADSLRPAKPCVIGGASFGGVVALEIAKFLKPQAIILIGSIRSPEFLPWRVRFFRPLRGLIPWVPVRLLQAFTIPIASKTSRRIAPYFGELARQFKDADPNVLRWSLRELLAWSKPPEIDCPIFQIQGGRDHILPIGSQHPATLIPTGGHVISLTNPKEVNAFIADCVKRVGLADFTTQDEDPARN